MFISNLKTRISIVKSDLKFFSKNDEKGPNVVDIM